MHRVSMAKVRNEVDRWLTPHEEERLLVSSSVWLREIIMFAMHTGMRQGEILNLQWRDIDFARSTLVVMKSKNGMRRTLPINSVVYEQLAAKQAKTGVTEGLVFTTPLGNELKVRFLAREFCEARDGAGIPDFRFHDLRHTFHEAGATRGRPVQGSAITRTQDSAHDATVRAPLARKSSRGRQRAHGWVSGTCG